jgi:peptidoglycan/LPS O-acetylase OafA/YrhL
MASVRYRGLDRLRGLGLWLMVIHHLNSWTVGSKLMRERVKGFERFATTDMAPVLFAVALGGAALIVGDRLRERRGQGVIGVVRRWAGVAGYALLVEMVLHHHFHDIGVLGILAICGISVTAAAALAGYRPLVWAPLALALTLEAGRAADWTARTPSLDFIDRKFPVVTYLAFAAWGTLGVACMRTGERAARLALLSAGTAVAVVIAANIDHWPPVRYPGDDRFILPGAAAGYALWALLAWSPAVRAMGPLAVWLERAGGRSLRIFVFHYVILVVLQETGVPDWLRNWYWPVLGALVIFAISARPPRRRSDGPEPVGRADAGSGSISV